MTETQTRTPMWAMTDEQLFAYADDEMMPWEKRQLAQVLLRDRLQERVVAKQSEEASTK